MRKFWITVLAVAVVLAIIIPHPIDFPVFYSAAQSVIHLQSPYRLDSGFFNPIWIAPPLLPFLAFPYEIAWRVHLAVAILVYTWAILRLAGNRRKAWIYGLSGFYIFATAQHGNIEYLPLLGLSLNPLIGIWLVLAKPQMGLLAAFIMLLEYRSQSGTKKTLLLAASLGLLLIFSYSIGMMRFTPLNQPWNISFFPGSLIFGAPLALLALWRRNRLLAFGAMGFISPYMTSLSSITFFILLAEFFIWANSSLPIHLLGFRIKYAPKRWSHRYSHRREEPGPQRAPQGVVPVPPHLNEA